MEETNTTALSADFSSQQFSKPGEERPEGVKWTYLEHHGVIFPDNYKHKGLSIMFRGKPILLNPIQEELAWYWTQSLESEYASKEAYRNNFEKQFLEALSEKNLEGPPAKLTDFDFSPIKAALAKEKEQREAQTKEEKNAIKEARAKAEAPFKYALIDGSIERISNVRIEPPTLFKGRGAHPKAGRLKHRVVPEDIELNLAKEAPAPILHCPGRSWGDIVYEREASWLAAYSEPITNGRKYFFLSAGSKLKGQSDLEKYEKARRLSKEIDRIRADYTAKMKSSGLKERQLGTAAYLIDFLAIRVGNEKNEDEADTVGCCSLRVEHLKCLENNQIKLDFLGKDSIRYENTVAINPVAWNNLASFLIGKGDQDIIFDAISPARLNDYLSALQEGLTAKVFRTFNASHTLQQELEKEVDKEETLEKKLEFYNEANRRVAVLCNHQKTVTKKAEEGLEKQEQKLEELKALHKKIKKSDKEYDKSKKKVEKLEKALEIRKKNKMHALNTSKINYNDPRITVAWCKKAEMPIEKVFTSVLLEKFTWSMETPSNWNFDKAEEKEEEK